MYTKVTKKFKKKKSIKLEGRHEKWMNIYRIKCEKNSFDHLELFKAKKLVFVKKLSFRYNKFTFLTMVELKRLENKIQ